MDYVPFWPMQPVRWHTQGVRLPGIGGLVMRTSGTWIQVRLSEPLGRIVWVPAGQLRRERELEESLQVFGQRPEQSWDDPGPVITAPCPGCGATMRQLYPRDSGPHPGPEPFPLMDWLYCKPCNQLRRFLQGSREGEFQVGPVMR